MNHDQSNLNGANVPDEDAPTLPSRKVKTPVRWLPRGRLPGLLLATAAFTLVFLWITDAWRLNLRRPIAYWGDALEMLAYFGRDYVFNDLLERFAAPFGIPHSSALRYVSHLFFEPASTLVLISYAVTREVVAALNLYFLLTFPLVFVSAYWAYGRMRLTNPFRFGAAALFALVPFHFLRRVFHLMESSYFAVPLLAYMVIRVFGARPFFHSYRDGKWRWSWKERSDWLLLIAVFFLSPINEYHQFFFAILLIGGALASTARHRNMRILAGAGIVIMTALSPTLIRRELNARLDQPEIGLTQIGSAISHYGEEEHFGLKLVQVVLPVPGHRLETLRHLLRTYDSVHEINENAMVCLGVFGAAGFLYLLGRGAYRLIKPRRYSALLDICSVVTLGCVLVGTVGGLSALFATGARFVFGPDSLLTQIRCYDRIIVYIAFFSYYATSCLLRKAATKLCQTVTEGRVRIGISYALWLPIFCVALWDQVPYTIANDERGVEQSESDKDFLARIERQLPRAALVFQYPFNIHHADVNGSAHGHVTYADGIRPYLNSEKLRFTYGGDSGSVQAGWLQETCALPLPAMIQRLCEYGFTGILVHRNLFRDPAEEAGQFEAELARVAATPLQESRDKELSFVALDGHCRDLAGPSSLPGPGDGAHQDDSVRAIDFSQEAYPDFVASTSGISGRESWGRWSDGPASVIRFTEALPKRFKLLITANAFGPNLGKPIRVRLGQINKTFTIKENTARTYILDVETPFPITEMMIIPPEPTSPASLDHRNPDARRAGVGLISIRIQSG